VKCWILSRMVQSRCHPWCAGEKLQHSSYFFLFSYFFPRCWGQKPGPRHAKQSLYLFNSGEMQSLVSIPLHILGDLNLIHRTFFLHYTFLSTSAFKPIETHRNQAHKHTCHLESQSSPAILSSFTHKFTDSAVCTH
jgi:hypothetical protein